MSDKIVVGRISQLAEADPSPLGLHARLAEVTRELDQARHHVSVLLDVFASLPVVPAEAQAAVDEVQQEIDSAQ